MDNRLLLKATKIYGSPIYLYDLEKIKSLVNENTIGVTLVHCLGFNAITDELIEYCKEKDLFLIEDCCESHGATYNGNKIGTFGDVSNFSFYFGHHMTTIEGGMVCTNDDEIYQYAKMFRSHGMTRLDYLQNDELGRKLQKKYNSASWKKNNSIHINHIGRLMGPIKNKLAK